MVSERGEDGPAIYRFQMEVGNFRDAEDLPRFLTELNRVLSQSQSAGLQEGFFDGGQVCGGQNAETPFKSNRRERSDGLHVGYGFFFEKGQMTEWHFQLTSTILLRYRNVNDERTGRVEVIGDENDAWPGLGHHAHVHEPDLTVAWVHGRQRCPKPPALRRASAARRPKILPHADARETSDSARLRAAPTPAGA